MGIKFVCAKCGAKYANDITCGACGNRNDASLVHDPHNNPVQSVRPALPQEQTYFRALVIREQHIDPFPEWGDAGPQTAADVKAAALEAKLDALTSAYQELAKKSGGK